MKILLSSFACSPLWGSEPGVGWRWSLELAKKHRVTVLTHAYFQQHISDFAAANPECVLPEYRYIDMGFFGIHPHRLLNSRIYYTLWQFKAFLVARKLTGDHDVVHHLTWGTYRFPSFMGYLGKPFVKGPLGGGERAPFRLLPKTPRKAFLFEVVRSLLIQISRLDPLVWISNCSADLVLCKTQESLGALPPPARKRAIVAAEIGASGAAADACAKSYGAKRQFKLFFAGRLIGWKGAHLAITALARLRDRGVDATLTLAGDGDMRPFLVVLAKRLGCEQHVTFLGAIPRQTLLSMYREMDLFLFPSLHDSSGNVLLESMSVGLPVVCLDLGGPRYFVNDTCGRVVETGEQSEDEVCNSLASTLQSLLNNPDLMTCLSEGAIRRCQELTWEKQVDSAYREIVKRLELVV